MIKKIVVIEPFYVVSKVKKFRKWFKMIATLLGIFIILVAICNIFIIFSTKSSIYYDIDKIPEKNAGLVLGTSKYVKGGRINLFFKYRIDAAAQLYHAGKVKHLILSGDNSSKDYNEPALMQKDLIAKGVPAEALTLDFAGLRTFDSMVRCRDVFNQEDIVVISQPFHLERAIFICEHYHIEAVGFAAQEVSFAHASNTYFRESFAKMKMLLDLYVLQTAPKFRN
ncbi:MAG: YdcF family protein [Verrucomicrobia bacterium]|nr:YdcF family protein [Cytophagales bacterium]